MYSDSKEWYLDAYVSPNFAKRERASTNTKGRGAKETMGTNKKPDVQPGFSKTRLKALAIRARRPQLAGHEVIRRPRTADEDFAVLQLARSA